MKAARETAPKVVSKAPNLEDGDTAGVAIISAAQTYASNQRAMTFTQHARFESLVRAGFWGSEDVSAFLEIISWDDLQLSLLNIRDELKLLFEGVIWAKLYHFNRKSGRPNLFQNAGKFDDSVPEPLAIYLRKRFSRMVEQWGMQRGKRLQYDRQAPGVQLRYLRDYFWDIVDKLPELPENALQHLS